MPGVRPRIGQSLGWCITSKTALLHGTLLGSQAEAIRPALVVTGGPGVGETTLVDAIPRVLSAKGVRLPLRAPTGRAAKRMTEASGREAGTVHRPPEFDPEAFGFKRGGENPLDRDPRVVDGASGADAPLELPPLKAVSDHAALLIVGDVDQPPSVGPGQVLADVVGSGAAPTVRSTEVFRQAARSKIVVNARRTNQGRTPDLAKREGGTDFHFVAAPDPGQAVSRLVDLVRTRIPERFGRDPIRDIQALRPMNRGGVGARALDVELQAAPNASGEPKVERFGRTFAPDDKVMRIENACDKEAHIGDIGYVEGADLDEGAPTASRDGRTIARALGERDALVPPDAAAIHKGQGSEGPAAVIPVRTQPRATLRRDLRHTGVTRGKRLVVLVGRPRAVAVRNVSGRRRWSKLGERPASTRPAARGPS